MTPHGEEDIRNFFLAALNTYFEGQATGETFRKSGKTDILISEKNRAAFVAECKLWRGEQYLLEGLDQLLAYATWRDSKCAILLFNKNVAGFESIRAGMAESLGKSVVFRAHHQVVELGEWRIIAAQPEDEAQLVRVHVFLFNFYASAA
jgi:hypothetical protein